MSVFFFDTTGTKHLTDAIAEVKKVIAQSEDMYGSHYANGEMGQKLNAAIRANNSVTFENEAENWLLKNTHNDGPVILVQVKAPDEASEAKIRTVVEKSSKKISKAHASERKAQEQAAKLKEDVFKALKSSKTEFKACSSCSSKIAVKHLANLRCPVCRHENAFGAIQTLDELKRIKKK
ncbi:hypothetical protein I3271_00870 [Photobacterium leiognathi]|uniref:hypothetical protein n=1 Tax=Photobacterium leiognathi TaxID=553611 RepID=UPI001EDDA4DA|nr:hypothetical protein [Photobacterium leiognathi]MCG3883234.1 hypothetical protein [Photobacterium leiognathi]